MTPYELFNLQRGIGDLEGIIRQQQLNPRAFTPIENWVISHLKVRKMSMEREQAVMQERELQKRIDKVADEVVKEIQNKFNI